MGIKKIKKIRTEEIRANISEQIRGATLKWLGHAEIQEDQNRDSRTKGHDGERSTEREAQD